MKLLVKFTTEFPNVEGIQRDEISSRVWELEKQVANSTVFVASAAWYWMTNNRLALMYSSNSMVEDVMQQILPTKNLDCFKSSDQLFRMPKWMSFYNIPSGDLLTRHYGYVEGSGLLQYWKKVMENPPAPQVSLARKIMPKDVFELLLRSMSIMNVRALTFKPAGMDDSVTAEIFAVGQVGVLTAVLIFLLELICKRFTLMTGPCFVMVAIHKWAEMVSA